MKAGTTAGYIDKQTLCNVLPGLPSLLVDRLEPVFGKDISIRELLCSLVPCWGGEFARNIERKLFLGPC